MTSAERDFEGRVAIVTGAARGLGRAVAARSLRARRFGGRERSR